MFAHGRFHYKYLYQKCDIVDEHKLQSGTDECSAVSLQIEYWEKIKTRFGFIRIMDRMMAANFSPR